MSNFGENVITGAQLRGGEGEGGGGGKASLALF